MPQYSTENNCHLNYEIQEPAQVKPLVNALFVHGYAYNMDEWKGYNRLVGKNVRIILVDMYGHGLSSWIYPPNAKNEDMENAQDIISLTKHLSLGKYFVVGHSVGGRIAGLIASLDSENVIGTILINPISMRGLTPAHDQYFFPPLTNAMSLGTVDAITKACTQMNAESPVRMHEAGIFLTAIMRSMDQEGNNTQARAVSLHTDRSEIISQMKCPVLFLTGDKDPFCPETLKELNLFKNVVPNLHCLYDMGHMMVVEDVLVVAPVIASFIDKHSK